MRVYDLGEYSNGNLNNSIDLYNQFNQKIFNYHNINPGQQIDKYNLLITMTQFEYDVYGDKFIDSLKKRLKLTKQGQDQGLNYLRSVIMDPWMADTYEGDKNLNFFEVAIIPTLRETVLKCVEEMIKQPKND